MLARLWWKDWRQFGPIWALLAVLALGAQALLLHYLRDSVQSGELAVAALGWTCLYAFAVAAAAFAGERETRTMLLLDTLPVERWRIWVAKASFALVSSVALGLLLFAAASPVTEKWPNFSPGWGFLLGVAILLAVLGCGLFWSSAISNALSAAVLALFTVLLAVPALAAVFGLEGPQTGYPALHLALGLLALAASFAVLVRTGPPSRPLIATRTRDRTAAQGAAALQDTAFAPPRPWRTALPSLAWQTFREASPLAGPLLLASLVAPILISIAYNVDPVFGVLGWGGIVAFVAGLHVFGTETSAGTQRFLANHGVRPGLVWLVKMSVWLAAMGVVWGLGLLLIVTLGPGLKGSPADPSALPYVALGTLTGGMAVAVLCGMIFRRGTTAAVIAIVVWLLLAFGLAGLFALGVLPALWLILVPLAILAVSFAWSGDWLLDRPGARRWVKLAALLAAAFGLLFAGYTTHRVASVPALAPVIESEVFALRTPGMIPEAENAASLYRRAADVIAPSGHHEAINPIIEGRGPKAAAAVRWFEQNANALDIVRQAAAMPSCQFEPIERLNPFSTSLGTSSIYQLWPLPAFSVQDRQARGNLDGAWSDIVVMLRMARHSSGDVRVATEITSLIVERQALGLAMKWAADSHQTPQRLRAALGAYQDLPPMPGVSEALKVEARIVMNAESLSHDELTAQLLVMRSEQLRSKLGAFEKFWVDVVASPWERARAARAFRLLYAAVIEDAKKEPFASDRAGPWRGSEWPSVEIARGNHATTLAPATLDEIFRTTPLAQAVFPVAQSYMAYADRNEVARRAVVQILALRIWQLEHQGRLPESLQQVVEAGILPELPTDPFTPRRHFGYIRSLGQRLLPLGNLDPLSPSPKQDSDLATTENFRLLYSVDEDRKDDGARVNAGHHEAGDFIFPMADGPPGNP